MRSLRTEIWLMLCIWCMNRALRLAFKAKDMRMIVRIHNANRALMDDTLVVKQLLRRRS